jgi:DNA-directed RNA polymerase sigma subunit (sigma70/sigma32)
MLLTKYPKTLSNSASMRAVGQALGITKGRAQVIETNALAKLRATSDATGIQDA